MHAMKDPLYDMPEPEPSHGVLTEEETARQVHADLCRQYHAEAIRLRRELSDVRATVHAAHGLLSPLGNQVVPSLVVIREVTRMLRGILV